MPSIEQYIEGGGDAPLDTHPAAAIFTTDLDEKPAARADFTRVERDETETKGMKGSAPKNFAGDRKDSERFLEEFTWYWKLNRKNASMKEPYSRVLLAISYMKGEKVRNWNKNQVNLLDKRVDEQLVSPDDERLWKAFAQDFKSAFTNTTEKQDAYVKLKSLKMTGGDLDTYISDHEALVLLTGWNLEGDGSVEAFHDGLTPGLKIAILKRDDLPVTLDEWKTAAKKEQTKWALIKSSGLLKSGGKGSDRQNKWKNALSKREQTKKDPDAMDVDNVRLGPLTDEERKKLSAEGRCFRCRQLGHMSRTCPKRQDGQTTRTTANQAKVETTKSRTTEIVDDRDDISEIGSDGTATSVRTIKVNAAKLMPNDVVKALEGLTEEQRGEVLDQILLKEGDF